MIECKLFLQFVLGIINEIVLTDDNFSCKFLACLIRYFRRRKQLMNACKICGFFSCSMFSEDCHSGKEQI